MLGPYRAVLSRPGALAFSSSGLVARLPISMVGLGLVLLVERATGSYGAAGAVSAAYIVGNAGFAVVSGRLVDRFGQDRVLPALLTVFATALSACVAAVQAGWGAPGVHLLAALAGATMPQVGSCVRARWAHLLRSEPDRINTAFSVEAVVDETVFILGPTLVTVLATAWHPVAGLAVAVASGLLGGLALAAQRRTQPPPGGRDRVLPGLPEVLADAVPGAGPYAAHADARSLRKPVMPWGLLALLVLCSATLGTVFGGVEVATVALSDELGRPVWAGPLLAAWAAGSLLAGVVVGAATWRRPTVVRFRWSALALGLSLVPLPFVGSLLVLAPVLLVAGLAISPTLITLTALVEEGVPPARLTEGLAVVHSGMAAGVAPGAAVVGVVVDAAGASAGFWVPLAAGLLGAAVATAVPSPRRGRTLDAVEHQPEPVADQP